MGTSRKIKLEEKLINLKWSELTLSDSIIPLDEIITGYTYVLYYKSDKLVSCYENAHATSNSFSLTVKFSIIHDHAYIGMGLGFYSYKEDWFVTKEVIELP